MERRLADNMVFNRLIEVDRHAAIAMCVPRLLPGPGWTLARFCAAARPLEESPNTCRPS